VRSDYLVIGSGIAGLSYALRVAERGNVIIVTKKRESDSATNLAQGGIAAVLGEDDSFESHIRDTLEAGDGLCDSETVRRIVSSGRARVEDLMNYGVDFVKTSNNSNLSLGREGGHSHRRIAHAYDLTGRAIESALLNKVKNNSNIKILEEHMAVDLMIRQEEEERICFGAYVMRSDQTVFPVQSQVTVLCTGGAGKVYLYTSNPDIATGDGVAMAYRAGAKIANMEFVQFHPTCLFHPQSKNFLISEAVRGEGAVLLNSSGSRFMHKYDVRGELATRDCVALSIDREMKESGDDCVYLDISHKEGAFIEKRFPTIYKTCLSYGIDMKNEPIPVVPAAHYLCGGVLVDKHGNSNIAGLMALGETSCTGLHGANRLASNSLLEAVVYAHSAAEYCLTHKTVTDQKAQSYEPDEWSCEEAEHLNEAILVNHNWDVIRRTMWNYVGIVRGTKRLNLAKKRLTELVMEIEELYINYHVSQNMMELRNIAHVSLMIVESALLRKESRGLHYCVDYAEKQEASRMWTVLSREINAQPWQCSAENIDFCK
jgi:L-aspartate oxidase